MAKIISCVAFKGGVGKTTTCVNLCAALVRQGKKVLLCDMDPQGNATSAMGISKNKIRKSIYDVLIRGEEGKNAILLTKSGDVLPANRELSGAGIELVGIDSREYILKNALEKLRDQYDFILIDCPPSLELLTVNSLTAADGVLVPVQCEYFALEGLSDLMNIVRIIKRRLNPQLEIEGVLLTMYDSRTNLSFQVAEEVKKFFKEKVYNTAIPRNVRLSEAPSHGKPVTEYDFSSRGAQAYLALGEEVIKRNEKGG